MRAAQPIVVVGAGTAGCTVVSYLASHTEYPIVAVEPGPMSRFDDVSRFMDVLTSDMIETTSIGYVQARALGGGSAVNGMLLTGDEPEHLRGLTRMATDDDIGVVGQSLLLDGGRLSRLWWNGGRWNPGRAVAHLVEEGRVTIQPRNVTQLLHENGYISAVLCGEETISASAVVLCAGAIASPTILLQSGLGNINPKIGHGLQNHPTISASFVHEPSDSDFDAAVIREWETNNGGLMMNVAYERMSSLESDKGLLSVSLMNPRSRGRVSADSIGHITPDFALLNDEFDVINMEQGLRDLVRLLRTGRYSSDVNSIVLEGTPLGEVESLTSSQMKQWLFDHVQGVSHASSSCSEAVDEKGRVLGLENAWVADASVLAKVPSCTPAAPVTMEALRIAHHIGESLS